MRIETALDAHDLRRLEKELEKYGLPASLDEGYLVLDGIDIGREVEHWVERLIRYNRSIHALAKREGTPIKPYKSRDLVNLYVAVLIGLTSRDVAVLAHEVIWRQPFANANHRTMTAALIEAFGVAGSTEYVRHLSHPLFEDSKNLLDGSDKSLSDDEAKQLHLQITRHLVKSLQSMR